MVEVSMGYWFKTPIWRAVLEGHEVLNENLLKVIDELRRRDPEGVSRSNLGGWQSNPHLHREPAFRPFVELLERILDTAVRKPYKLSDDAVVEIESMWANVNSAAASNAPHVHANSHWSASYYVKTPNQCGDIWFYDPRPAAGMLEYPVFEQGDLTSSEMQFPVSAGSLLIFPSYLLHSVEPNMSGEERVSIAFNAKARRRE